MSWRFAAGLAAIGVTAAGPALATDPYVPVFNTERVYARCGTASRATVGAAVTYPWNTTKPATSFTAGGGCGALDTDKTEGDEVTFQGTHTGNLNRISVHAWVIDAGPVRAGAYDRIYVDATLEIDGETLVSGEEVRMVPKPSSTGIARLLEFSVTGIGLVNEDQAGEHQIRLTLSTSPYIDGDQLAWVLDASEVDTGLTFSPAALSGPLVDLTPPEEE